MNVSLALAGKGLMKIKHGHKISCEGYWRTEFPNEFPFAEGYFSRISFLFIACLI